MKSSLNINSLKLSSKSYIDNSNNIEVVDISKVNNEKLFALFSYS